jgi:CRP-like cAMP-binding protein
VFPETCLGSIVVISPAGYRVEAGVFGRDGLSPIEPVMGADVSPHEITVQVPGSAYALPRATMAAVLDARPAFRTLLTRYVQALSVQTSYTALSNAVHAVDQRLARWLLMSDDRLDGPEIPLTHEFLSIMLGVRRPSVTTALHVLEGEGLIRSLRGCVVVRNRAALEAFAGDAYGASEAEYARLIGPLK